MSKPQLVLEILTFMRVPGISIPIGRSGLEDDPRQAFLLRPDFEDPAYPGHAPSSCRLAETVMPDFKRRIIVTSADLLLLNIHTHLIVLLRPYCERCLGDF
ncbi:hypothetical protein ACQZ5N_26135 [Agrobacterium sp. 22-221-1]